MSREHREDHMRARGNVRSAVEGVDQMLQEEFTRVAEDATVEGRRHETNLRFRLKSVGVTMTDTLEQKLAEQDKKCDRVLVSLQRAVEERTRYHRAGTEALDGKLTNMVGSFAAEHTRSDRRLTPPCSRATLSCSCCSTAKLPRWSTETSARSASW